MKKILLSALLCAGLYAAQAQTSSVTMAKLYQYCQIFEQPRAFSTKLNIIVDFGQETKFFQDTRMRDEESGKLVKFNSLIDALNYMSEQGWEFVQVYNTFNSTGGANGGVFSGNTRMVLRKEVARK
jgi:hypothetical protein